MSSPGQVYLTRFTTPVGAPSFFYAGTENATLDVTIQIFPTDCIDGGARGTAAYTTENGSAVGGEDYTARSGTTGEMCNDLHYDEGYCGQNPPPPQRSVSIPLSDDSGTDAAVETFRFRLTGGSNAGLASPFSAPVHIIDADGSERFSFEPNLSGSAAVTYQKLERARGIEIPVFRAGSSTVATSVAITSEGSGEHHATEGVDYRVPDSVDFAAGQRLKWLEIELVNDSLAEEDETFDVTLADPGMGELIETTTVSILDEDAGGPGANEAPGGRLHHPKHRFRYPQNYPYLNEIHIFTSAVKGEKPPSSVFEAQLALRKRLKGGACAWWKGDGFTRGSCDQHRWFDIRKPPRTKDYFLYRVKKRLPKSVGKTTRVRNYQIWGRWFDSVGRQSRLGVGRNMNSFEVIAPIKECRRGSPLRFTSKCKPKRP